MTKAEILLKAMQISGIQADINKAHMVLAFKEKLEQFGMGLSLREIEDTGARVTREIMAENMKVQKVQQAPVEEKVLPLSEGGEA